MSENTTNQTPLSETQGFNSSKGKLSRLAVLSTICGLLGWGQLIVLGIVAENTADVLDKLEILFSLGPVWLYFIAGLFFVATFSGGIWAVASIVFGIFGFRRIYRSDKKEYGYKWTLFGILSSVLLISFVIYCSFSADDSRKSIGFLDSVRMDACSARLKIYGKILGTQIDAKPNDSDQALKKLIQEIENRQLKCPVTGQPFKLTPNASQINTLSKEESDNFPLIICTEHPKQNIVLLASGKVEERPKENTPKENEQ